MTPMRRIADQAAKMSAGELVANLEHARESIARLVGVGADGATLRPLREQELVYSETIRSRQPGYRKGKK